MTQPSPALLDADPPEPPAEVRRPAFAHFLWSRRIELRDAGRAIGRSHTAVANYCRAFDDPRRVEPDDLTAKRIERYTRGLVPPASFKDPAGDASATPAAVREPVT